MSKRVKLDPTKVQYDGGSFVVVLTEDELKKKFTKLKKNILEGENMAKTNNENEGNKLPRPPSTGKYRKASALENGQSITGTVIGFRTEYSEKLSKTMTSIAMRDGDQEFELSPAGTLNDSIAAGQLKVGRTYRFTKEGLEKTKKGGYKNVFGVYDLTSKNSNNNAANEDI